MWSVLEFDGVAACAKNAIDKDKRLSDIDGIKEDGQYEFDVEEPSAAGAPSNIKILAGTCSILGEKNEVFELKSSEPEYRIMLKETGFVSIP